MRLVSLNLRKIVYRLLRNRTQSMGKGSFRPPMALFLTYVYLTNKSWL